MRQLDCQRKQKRKVEQHKRALVLNYKIRGIDHHSIYCHILEPRESRWSRYPVEDIHENRVGVRWSLDKGYSIIKALPLETSQELRLITSTRFRGAHIKNIEL
jgi:hypothetical protein